MKKPFQFIEYKNTTRSEFFVTEGRQPTLALFYLKEGSFCLRMEGEEQIIGSGDCVLFADDVDFTRFVIEPISFVYLKFRMNPKCPFVLPLPVGRIVLRDLQRFLSNMATYEALREAEDPRSVYLCEHALEDILLQISREYTGSRPETEGDAVLRDCHDSLVLKGACYIRERIHGKISISEICRALSTNPSTLNFRFRKALSQSVGDFITGERMRTACRLLANTTFSVGTVAQRCGYENIYYFSTVFRKCHGIPPGEYRKRHRGG